MSDTIREQIVKVSKLMYDKGMVNAFAGNLSVRDGDNLYITPSGICKGFLREDMIVKTDMNGNVLEGMYRPSSEIKLHLGIYRERKDVYSVAHAHPPYTTAYAVANKAIESKACAEMVIFFEKIPLAAYGTPSTDEIFSGVEEYINEYDVILLANHGIVSAGRDVFDAYFKLKAAEDIAKTLILSQVLGGEKDLPEGKLKELGDIRKRSKNYQ
ncbi:class II aldolase/adducin family protein [Acetivibrio mesophilus]|uniref:Class II aldolase/adducin family protein n=1 Tax=Acetivibrio mesophilus TaxID=2487273 RepID=A0A4Q0I5Q2_9FIRM|nr:class II aldolase/adducin family protein [Acetivibrio mesophilus]RXE59578.1 class II aldolase/adducin family protein [Acetivibrio mesophilus]